MPETDPRRRTRRGFIPIATRRHPSAGPRDVEEVVRALYEPIVLDDCVFDPFGRLIILRRRCNEPILTIIGCTNTVVRDDNLAASLAKLLRRLQIDLIRRQTGRVQL